MLGTRSVATKFIRRSNRLSFCTFGVFKEGERAREREFIQQEERKTLEELKIRRRSHLADELKRIIDKNPTPITKFVFDSLVDWKLESTIEDGIKGAPCFQHDHERDAHIRSRNDVV